MPCSSHGDKFQKVADQNQWDTCGICNENLELAGDRKPRALPCQHVMCSSCVNRIASDGMVKCPWCARMHKPDPSLAGCSDSCSVAVGFASPLMQMQYLEVHLGL